MPHDYMRSLKLFSEVTTEDPGGELIAWVVWEPLNTVVVAASGDMSDDLCRIQRRGYVSIGGRKTPSYSVNFLQKVGEALTRRTNTTYVVEDM